MTFIMMPPPSKKCMYAFAIYAKEKCFGRVYKYKSEIFKQIRVQPAKFGLTN